MAVDETVLEVGGCAQQHSRSTIGRAWRLQATTLLKRNPEPARPAQLVRQHMRDDAKVATAYDKVYKDECMFCFATSESPGGLYINLRTFQAFDEAHVDLDQERTGAVLYLHEQAHRVRPHGSQGRGIVAAASRGPMAGMGAA